MSEHQPNPEAFSSPVEVWAVREPSDGSLSVQFDYQDPDQVTFDEPEPGSWIFFDQEGNLTGLIFDSEVSADFCARFVGSDFAAQLHEGVFQYQTPLVEQAPVRSRRQEHFTFLQTRRHPQSQ